MSKTDPSACDDDRVNRARRGSLSAHEWEQLTVHLVACAECRTAWRFARDFDGSAGARPGDERLVARATSVALAGSPRRLLVVRAAAAAAAGIVLLVGVASAALLLDIGRDRWTRDRATAAPASEAAGARSRRRASGGGQGAASVAAPAVEAPQPEAPPPAAVPAPAAPAPAPAIEAASARPADLEAARAAESRIDPAPAGAGDAPARHRSSALASASSASSGGGAAAASARLFAQAVEARRAGHADRAIALFRELQTTYPATSEARVTLVSLGDLLMARADPASALAAFDEYLERNPQGPLVPEALNGRARALTALGRSHDAQEALRELDTRVPGSPYTRTRNGPQQRVRP